MESYTTIKIMKPLMLKFMRTEHLSLTGGCGRELQSLRESVDLIQRRINDERDLYNLSTNFSFPLS
ncbi:MAG: hypothetical protein IJU48_08935 [Synergistaceae bacterium]|nr:hypothetical protein [Synergistaceae bacterium]